MASDASSGAHSPDPPYEPRVRTCVQHSRRIPSRNCALGTGRARPGWQTDAMPDAAGKPTDDTPASPDPDSADPKERYRQALERKNAKGGHQGHGQATSNSSSKGSSAKAGGKREFRRKSG